MEEQNKSNKSTKSFLYSILKDFMFFLCILSTLMYFGYFGVLFAYQDTNCRVVPIVIGQKQLFENEQLYNVRAIVAIPIIKNSIEFKLNDDSKIVIKAIIN